jgi:hypothetical protein
MNIIDRTRWMGDRPSENSLPTEDKAKKNVDTYPFFNWDS